MVSKPSLPLSKHCEDEMVQLVITLGLPASGKSTFAKNWVAQDVRHRAQVERDQLRLMMHDGVWKGHHTESQIVTAEISMVTALLKSGISVVVSDTNLPPDTVEQWRTVAANTNAVFVPQDFTDVSLKLCIDRNAQRAGRERIPEDAILSMYDRYIKPKRIGEINVRQH